MGGGGSQTINQNFNMSAINKSIFESITENKASAVASGAVVQNLRVVMRNVRGCASDFSQKVESMVTSSSELLAENETEIKNAITIGFISNWLFTPSNIGLLITCINAASAAARMIK